MFLHEIIKIRNIFNVSDFYYRLTRIDTIAVIKIGLCKESNQFVFPLIFSLRIYDLS